MKMTAYEKARDSEVFDWLKNSIPEITSYQLERIRRDEIIRFAPIEFYIRRKKPKTTILWRLTIILVPVYLLLFWLVFAPLKFVFTGSHYMPQKMYENFHSKWMQKLNLD